MKRSRIPEYHPHLIIAFEHTLIANEHEIFSLSPSAISVQVDSELYGQRFVPLEDLVDAYLSLEKKDEVTSGSPV